MARVRSREQLCPDCHCKRSVIVNLDNRTVITGSIPPQCIHGMMDCMTEMRDKALLAPFEDGKVRTRR